jgi:putative tricarboxylic transport membrane protein
MSDPDPPRRRLGEAVFAVFIAIFSLVLLWSAYGISGLEALSAPGSVPMAATLVMVVTTLIVLVQTLRLPRTTGETLSRDILPGPIIAMVLLLVAYAVLLRPLGFLPTSALFLILSIRLLSRRGWAFSIAVSLGSLLLIWLVFRIVFTVLMPPGLVPEGEIVQFFRNLLNGGA